MSICNSVCEGCYCLTSKGCINNIVLIKKGFFDLIKKIKKGLNKVRYCLSNYYQKKFLLDKQYCIKYVLRQQLKKEIKAKIKKAFKKFLRWMDSNYEVWRLK